MNHTELNEDNDNDKDDNTIYDIIIVGGGVVGLAILQNAVTIQGYKCILIEKENDLLKWASGSNSGIICTGVDTNYNTLERSLIRDSISQIRSYCSVMNIPIRSCGSLICQWDWDINDDNTNNDKNTDDVCSNDKSASENNSSSSIQQKSSTTGTSSISAELETIVHESHMAGDIQDTLLLCKSSIQQLEPNIAYTNCTGAVHIKNEIILDPWLYSISLAINSRQNGGVIITNYEMDCTKSTYNENNNNIWTIHPKQQQQQQQQQQQSVKTNSHKQSVIKGKILIQATGVWSELCTKAILSSSTTCTSNKQQQQPEFTIRPRRGQYRIYKSNNTTIIQHPIQPIPTKYTKGIFVFSTIYNQLIVGPTSTEQKSLDDTTISETIQNELEIIIQRIIPTINIQNDYIDDYVGIRPGTNHNDYSIHTYTTKKYIVCAGIRSTGLTASLGIGRHVLHLVQQQIGMLPPTSNTQQQKSSASCDDNNKTTTTTSSTSATTRIKHYRPLPSVQEIAKMYNSNNQGSVTIDGYQYKVTHPISRYGLQMMSNA